jgi:response regulator NasT
MPKHDLAILIVDENRSRASIIEEGLREAGHHRVTVIHDVNDVGRTLEASMPDVVVIDLENPKRDTLEHFFSLSRSLKRPIAMFVDHSDEAMIERAVEAGVSAYVVDGLKKERVRAILSMAISRFNAFSRLTEELHEARSQLDDRRIVEQAKGILMRSRALSEDEAHGLLRRQAMQQNRRLIEIARSVVTAAELLDPGRAT